MIDIAQSVDAQARDVLACAPCASCCVRVLTLHAYSSGRRFGVFGLEVGGGGNGFLVVRTGVGFAVLWRVIGVRGLLTLHVYVGGESSVVVGHGQFLLGKELLDAVEGRVDLNGFELVTLSEPLRGAGALVDALTGGGRRLVTFVSSLSLAFVALREAWDFIEISPMSCSSLSVKATRACRIGDAKL